MGFLPPHFQSEENQHNVCVWSLSSPGLWSLILFSSFLYTPPTKPYSQVCYSRHVYQVICLVSGIMKTCIVFSRADLLRRGPSVLLKAKEGLIQSPFTGWSIGFDLTAWSLASAALVFQPNRCVSASPPSDTSQRRAHLSLPALPNPDSYVEMVLEMLCFKDTAQRGPFHHSGGMGGSWPV